MIACAALQRLERYGSLGLKRHSVEDFVSTSLKDARRANIYALTLLSTWKEAVQAVRGGDADNSSDTSKAPARYTEALVYAVSFAVALTTQHLFEVNTNVATAPVISMNDSPVLTAAGTGQQAKKAAAESVSTSSSSNSKDGATAASLIFTVPYAQALELLTLLKEMTVAIGSSRALRSNASSDDFTKAVAHLLTSSTDLALLLLGDVSIGSNAATPERGELQPGGISNDEQQRKAILAQVLVLVTATAQMLRRVQVNYPINHLYHTRPCAALLKIVANKHKQLQQRHRHSSCTSEATAEKPQRATNNPVSRTGDGAAVHEVSTAPVPVLLSLLRRYIQVSARCSLAATQQPSPPTSSCAASLFSIFSLFQRLSMLHGALGAVADLSKGLAAQLSHACDDVQYWLSQLLSSTACNRATRYVVYFREDELRLMQHNVRQASEYALFTFATTPPADPGLVESLLAGDAADKTRAIDDYEEVTHARAALVLAQWCVSAPFYFESFCRNESWASFAQEQRRLVLQQESRARRGLERTSHRQQRRERARQKALLLGEAPGGGPSSVPSGASSVHSDGSDSAASTGGCHQRQRRGVSGDDETASLSSFQTDRHVDHADASVGGSLTSLASRVSLLSTFSKHSTASYLSFISVLRPSAAADSVAGGAGARYGTDGDGEGAATDTARQMHESEDGNTNLPLILLEQLTLGLHRFMEAYPAELLDRYGLRSVSWNSIARMFAIVEASLANHAQMTAGTAAAAAARRHTNHHHSSQEQQQPLFNLAQDIRYNKGMGYECLGLLFAKVVAPLLDLTPSRASTSTSGSPSQQQLPRGHIHEVSGANDGESGDVGSSSIGGYSNGNRAKEERFANATVGSAVLTLNDDSATRASVEAALSTCLTAYEKVAPQVVDMSLSTILRLASRTAITSAGMTTPPRPAPLISSLSSMLVAFVRDITARLGRSNDLPRLVDALLEQRDFAANANAAAAVSAAIDGSGDTASSIRSLRAMFSHPSVRQAVMAAAGTSLDPESLLGRLSSVAAELVEARNGKISSGAQDEEQGEAASTATSHWTHNAAQVQRMLLALELMEALLAGVVPTSVSASALLEHAAQLELLLSASFMTAVEELQRVNPAAAAAAARDSGTRARSLYGDLLHDRRLLMIQHIYTIRQCRAVTILCLQDLGTQHVHDYLRMLEDVLWQLTSHVGNLVGSLTLAELQPLLQAHTEWYNNSEVVAPSPSVPGQLQLELLPPSLILQRLSLARTVTVALGTHAGPEAELRDMVAYLWDCLGKDRLDTAAKAHLRPAGVSLWLANQMTSEEWVSLVALGKEKDGRASMMELLLRSAAVSSAERTETPAWLSRCLQCIPATVTRALVDAFVSLPVEDLCDTFCESASLSARQQRELARRQWMVLTASLVAAYAVVGHNPYWPSVVAHTVCAVTHVARVWRKYAKERLGDADGTSAQALHRSTEMHSFALLMRQLLSVLLCTLRSEPRATSVLRRVLLTLARESAVALSSAARPTAPALSRCGMSVAYVEALKVPATSLSDLSAPATLTAPTLTTAVNEGEEDEVFVALKGMTFEDELRGVGIQLFAPAFVKRLLTLTGLCSDSTAVVMPLTFATAAAVISASMSTLALLYQICVDAAQASWRARTTDGSLEALVQTPAVVFLHAVASGFHAARGAAITSSNGASTGAATTVALTAFLEQFYGHAGAPAAHRLFVHIASAAAGDMANGTTASSAPRAAAVASPDALEAVEKLWYAQLRSIACTVMHLSHTAEGECNASAAVLQKACVTFRQLFTCMWSSDRSKQHQMSKGSGSRTGGRSGGGSKRVRSHGDSEPAAHHSHLSGGIDAFLAEVLALSRTAGDDSSDAVGGVTGNSLRCQLADFFGITATATKGAARSDVHVGRVCDRLWMRLLSAGEEAGVCALWLLWKLQCVSAALIDDSATTEGLQDDSRARMRKFLCAYCDMNACVEGDAATAGTTSAYTRVATMLRALPNTLRVLTAEGAPPLFHEHVNSLLTSTIPRASPRSSADASSFAVAAPAAAELLVHLFSVRPRLPAEMLLPHAQHLLVWLSSPSSSVASLAAAAEVGVHGGTSPSLSSLCIRVCAAVAAHPAVSSASDASALIAYWASQQQLIACRGVRQPRVNSGAAQELLDNVWLVLLSLLEGSRAPHCAEASTTTTTPLLREGELVQLILLLTKTWLGHSAHQQVLWSRPAMLPPLMCALFTCVMRGMESQEFSPRVLNVLASGLAAMAAHVDAATANEGDADVDSIEGADDDAEGVDEENPEESGSGVPAAPGDGRHRKQKRRLEGGARGWAKATTVPAHVKRAALAAATSALFEVAHHYIHVFTTFSSDMDFLFTDFLKVLSQHFLPAVTRPPIAHHVGVRIGGTAWSEMTFADLAYMCVGNAESKSLLKQAALRMEEAGVLDSSSASDGITAKAKAEPALTDGSRSIFRVA
ncbi:hypothetical protein Q4I28_001299 [Leishmania naiffi]|uniref:Non-specific serine/threonine protein kinase n=1 Tax=Leishmania naiffi TaxID=5678 RepID=A0AAW3C553_9TRYP